MSERRYMKNDRKKLRQLAKMMNTKDEMLIPVVDGVPELMGLVRPAASHRCHLLDPRLA